MDKICEIADHRLIFHINQKAVEVDLRQMIWPCSAFSLFYMLFWKKSGFVDMDHVKELESQSEDEPSADDKLYEPKEITIPALKGWVSSLFRKISRSPFGRFILINSSKRQGELDLFLKLSIPDPPTYYPIVLPDTDASSTEEIDLWSLIKPRKDVDSFHFNTISDYVNAYRDGTTTPLNVAKNVIAAIRSTGELELRIIVESHEDDILKRATESTERWKADKPLSVFDGVPVAVKDEVFLGGYPCRAGTPIKKYGKLKSIEEEGYMVRKLRNGGAVFIGVANMHQLGVGITGINPSSLHGTCRNPYNTKYPPGGSSSGPAAAVAAGLCPISLGADGGGSIRIPSSVNGIVGAKASFGRISGTGFHRNCDTVSHAGALCATTRDNAITYGFLAGRDVEYTPGLVQPPPHLTAFENKDLTGVKIGIDWNLFNDTEEEISEKCKLCVTYLVEKCGAKLVEISIPEMQESARAHVVTTLTEMYTYSMEIYHRYHDEINTDTEMNLGLGSTFTSYEYFLAQKQRTRAMKILKRLFKSVDCIITPTCGDFMPLLNEDILKYGFNNLKHLTAIIRFCVLGNLAGHPSISVPVGYSENENLPIGLLIQTAWWKEDMMFRIAHATEGFCPLRKPQVYYDVLSDDLPTGEDTSRSSPASSSPMLS